MFLAVAGLLLRQAQVVALEEEYLLEVQVPGKAEAVVTMDSASPAVWVEAVVAMASELLAAAVVLAEVEEGPTTLVATVVMEAAEAADF
jgi:hypothetical protein